MNSYCSAIDWPLSLNRSRTEKNGLSRDARVLKLMRGWRVRLPRRIAGGVPLANGSTASSAPVASTAPPSKSVMTRIDVQQHARCIAGYAPVRDLFEEVLRYAAIADISVHARADGEHVARPGPQIVEHGLEPTRHYPPADLLRIHGGGTGSRVVEPRRQCGVPPVITDGMSYRARILKRLVAEITKALIDQQFAHKSHHRRGPDRGVVRA